MPVSQADIEAFRSLTRSQLDALSKDFMQPEEVQRAARALLSELAQQKFRDAVKDFDAATSTFVDLTKKLLDITEKGRVNPVGDAVAVVTPILRKAGEIFSKVAETPTEDSPFASEGPGGETEAAEVDTSVPAATAGTPARVPPPGAATNSKKFAEIAGEYVAMFNAAQPALDKSKVIDRLTIQLASFKAVYQEVETRVAVPWYFVGLVHCLESNFNFGRHLHNGDSLIHRTSHVPRDRPPASVADPPFAWSTSAVDALTMKRLNTISNWTLARLLFELERYNGFGYRFRGLASPYLWSFSNRYNKGKFVADGRFDPNHVSKQCGTATLLKTLVAQGVVPLPPAGV